MLVRLSAVLLLAVGGGQALAGPSPLAVLSDVKGQVQVVHNKKTQSGRSGSQLFAGDMVLVVSGNATIFYATRPPQALKAGAQTTVTNETGPTPQTSTWKGVYTGLTSGFSRRNQTQAFAVRGNSGPCPLVPAGLIANTTPTLVWVAPKDAATMGIQGYEIYLFGPKKELMWRGTTTKTFIVYPNDAPPLEAEKEYVWQVVPLVPKTTPGSDARILSRDETHKSPGLWFRMAKAGESAQAETEIAQLKGGLGEMPLSSQNLALASALRKRGLATAAITLLMPEFFDPASQPTITDASPYSLIWPTFREAHAKLDDASQVMVNELAAQMDVNTSG